MGKKHSKWPNFYIDLYEWVATTAFLTHKYNISSDIAISLNRISVWTLAVYNWDVYRLYSVTCVVNDSSAINYKIRKISFDIEMWLNG